MLKPSLFNVVHRLSAEDSFVVYNTYSGGLLQVSSGVIDLVEAARLGNLQRALEKTSDPREAREVVDALQESGVLVPAQLDEFEDAWSWYRNKTWEDRAYLDMLGVVTLGCNLGCHYCFQGTEKPTLGMSRQTVEQIVDFGRQRLAEGDFEHVRVRIMGGEPLLNPAAVEGMVGGLSQLADAFGTTFSSHIITNGYLLKRKMISRLADAGLQAVRVSIHGSRSVHDANRATRGGKGTFDRILQGVEDVLDIVAVNLMLHFDATRSDDLELLFDELERRGLGPEVVGRVDINPIIDPGLNEGTCTDVCEDSRFSPELTREMMSARRAAAARGYDSQVDINALGCTIHQQNAFNFGPDGSIYQCMEAVGYPQAVAGHVSRPDELRYVDYLDAPTRDHCGGCNWFPTCGSGCRAHSLRTAGSLSQITCPGDFHAGFFDAFMREQCGELETGQGGTE